VVEQLLPVRNLTMFKHQFQRDILKEQVFGRTQDSRQTFLFLFCHGAKDSLAQPQVSAYAVERPFGY
jgi:hypothetical protein